MPRGQPLSQGHVVIWHSPQGLIWPKKLVCAFHSWAATLDDAVDVSGQSSHPCYQPLLVTAPLVTDLHRGHKDVAGVGEEAKIFWLLPSTYYWVAVEVCLTALDASDGKKGGLKGVVKLAVCDANGKCWIGVFYGTVQAECVATAGSFRHGPDITRVHVVDATVIASVHRRVACDGHTGIPIFTARLSNPMAVD